MSYGKSCSKWHNFVENQENEGFKIVDSGNPKFSRRRPMPAFSLVAFKQETAFHTPINPIFGPARGQIYWKMHEKLLFLDSEPKITKIRVWPKSQKFQNGFVDPPSPVFATTHPFSRYLAPLGAKYLEKRPKKSLKNARKIAFLGSVPDFWSPWRLR